LKETTDKNHLRESYREAFQWISMIVNNSKPRFSFLHDITDVSPSEKRWSIYRNDANHRRTISFSIKLFTMEWHSWNVNKYNNNDQIKRYVSNGDDRMRMCLYRLISRRITLITIISLTRNPNVIDLDAADYISPDLYLNPITAPVLYVKSCDCIFLSFQTSDVWRVLKQWDARSLFE